MPTEASNVEARKRTHRLRALFLAPAAQAWLERTTSARVLHAFERACNLINPDEEILALVTREVGAGPFSVVLDGGKLDFSEWVDSDAVVTVHSGRLNVGPLALDTRQAKLWNPRPEWEHLREQPDLLKAHLSTLQVLLSSHAPAGSLATLLTNRNAQGSSRDSLFETKFLEAARYRAEALCRGIPAGDVEACREAAGALAGLGGGLTPAGDDFLLGALYALWATRPSEQVAALVEAIVASAIPRTSRLSAAWLEAAARGEAGQPWHTLVEALVSADKATLVGAVHDILGVGHTSGADALAGFVLALGAGEVKKCRKVS